MLQLWWWCLSFWLAWSSATMHHAYLALLCFPLLIYCSSILCHHGSYDQCTTPGGSVLSLHHGSHLHGWPWADVPEDQRLDATNLLLCCHILNCKQTQPPPSIITSSYSAANAMPMPCTHQSSSHSKPTTAVATAVPCARAFTGCRWSTILRHSLLSTACGPR